MDQSTNEQDSDTFYALIYDESVHDWPGEIDFYRAMATRARSAGGAVLELACGTGRVAIRLARDGVRVVGLDISPAMIEVARKKSSGLGTVRWVEGDMRSFELGEAFDLVLVPGHSFQVLNTPQDQLACLESIKRHLNPAGELVVHLDHMNRENVRWLGGLCTDQGGVFKAAEEFLHPQTGGQVRALRAWSYEPATQSATAQTVWEEMDGDGQVVRRVERRPVRLHCVFRLEMEHLLARAGFEIAAVYGDFYRQELVDESPDMIWVARIP
jgi:ubiquinone/menaquinone biosynthesis C-methylase UbiE